MVMFLIVILVLWWLQVINSVFLHWTFINVSFIEFQSESDVKSVYAMQLACCCEWLCLQCFDAVGWAAGRASGL